MNRRLIWRRSIIITRSRSRGTASWRMASIIVLRIHLQVRTVTLRYRHEGAVSGRSRRITARAELYRVIAKIRL